MLLLIIDLIIIIKMFHFIPKSGKFESIHEIAGLRKMISNCRWQSHDQYVSIRMW